jgi:hypothetical protein
MKPRLLAVISCLLACLLSWSCRTGTAFSQDFDLEIPICMDPVGSGARAVGMGGAFIAVADDATDRPILSPPRSTGWEANI